MRVTPRRHTLGVGDGHAVAGTVPVAAMEVLPVTGRSCCWRFGRTEMVLLPVARIAAPERTPRRHAFPARFVFADLARCRASSDGRRHLASTASRKFVPDHVRGASVQGKVVQTRSKSS